MKTILSFILIITVISECQKEDHEESNSVVVDNAIELALVDPEGNDLLDLQNENAIEQSKINVFYLINGSLQEVYDTSKDYPRNFLVYKHENQYRIRVFLNSEENEATPETYIQWSESDTDTIKAEFRRSPSSLTIDKIWLNEEGLWPSEDKKELYFTLTK